MSELRIMRGILSAATALLTIGCLVPRLSAADAQTVLLDGAYEVDVRLELPHIDDNTAKKKTTICIGGDRADSHGLFVLSDNNPLAHCPASNLAQDGETLTFDIVCEGGNAARASAKYRLTARGFDGRIEMKMGGKNMTMTETQRGHRVGECAASGKKPPL